MSGKKRRKALGEFVFVIDPLRSHPAFLAYPRDHPNNQHIFNPQQQNQTGDAAAVKTLTAADIEDGDLWGNGLGSDDEPVIEVQFKSGWFTGKFRFVRLSSIQFQEQDDDEGQQGGGGGGRGNSGRRRSSRRSSTISSPTPTTTTTTTTKAANNKRRKSSSAAAAATTTTTATTKAVRNRRKSSSSAAAAVAATIAHQTNATTTTTPPKSTNKETKKKPGRKKTPQTDSTKNNSKVKSLGTKEDEAGVAAATSSTTTSLKLVATDDDGDDPKLIALKKTTAKVASEPVSKKPMAEKGKTSSAPRVVSNKDSTVPLVDFPGSVPDPNAPPPVKQKRGRPSKKTLMESQIAAQRATAGKGATTTTTAETPKKRERPSKKTLKERQIAAQRSAIETGATKITTTSETPKKRGQPSKKALMERQITAQRATAETGVTTTSTSETPKEHSGGKKHSGEEKKPPPKVKADSGNRNKASLKNTEVEVTNPTAAKKKKLAAPAEKKPSPKKEKVYVGKQQQQQSETYSKTASATPNKTKKTPPKKSTEETSAAIPKATAEEEATLSPAPLEKKEWKKTTGGPPGCMVECLETSPEAAVFLADNDKNDNNGTKGGVIPGKFHGCEDYVGITSSQSRERAAGSSALAVVTGDSIKRQKRLSPGEGSTSPKKKKKLSNIPGCKVDCLETPSAAGGISLLSVENKTTPTPTTATTITTENTENRAVSQPSKEKRKIVAVPPGKLGITLTKRQGQGVIISQIKPKGVVFQHGIELNVGDQLVAVDSVDVTNMPVNEIVTLLASNINKEGRTLTVITSKCGEQEEQGEKEQEKEVKLAGRPKKKEVRDDGEFLKQLDLEEQRMPKDDEQEQKRELPKKKVKNDPPSNDNYTHEQLRTALYEYLSGEKTAEEARKLGGGIKDIPKGSFYKQANNVVKAFIRDGALEDGTDAQQLRLAFIKNTTSIQKDGLKKKIDQEAQAIRAFGGKDPNNPNKKPKTPAERMQEHRQRQREKDILEALCTATEKNEQQQQQHQQQQQQCPRKEGEKGNERQQQQKHHHQQHPGDLSLLLLNETEDKLEEQHQHQPERQKLLPQPVLEEEMNEGRQQQERHEKAILSSIEEDWNICDADAGAVVGNQQNLQYHQQQQRTQQQQQPLKPPQNRSDTALTLDQQQQKADNHDYAPTTAAAKHQQEMISQIVEEELGKLKESEEQRKMEEMERQKRQQEEHQRQKEFRMQETQKQQELDEEQEELGKLKESEEQRKMEEMEKQKRQQEEHQRQKEFQMQETQKQQELDEEQEELGKLKELEEQRKMEEMEKQKSQQKEHQRQKEFQMQETQKQQELDEEQQQKPNFAEQHRRDGADEEDKRQEEEKQAHEQLQKQQEFPKEESPTLPLPVPKATFTATNTKSIGDSTVTISNLQHRSHEEDIYVDEDPPSPNTESTATNQEFGTKAAVGDVSKEIAASLTQDEVMMEAAENAQEAWGRGGRGTTEQKCNRLRKELRQCFDADDELKGKRNKPCHRAFKAWMKTVDSNAKPMSYPTFNLFMNGTKSTLKQKDIKMFQQYLDMKSGNILVSLPAASPTGQEEEQERRKEKKALEDERQRKENDDEFHHRHQSMEVESPKLPLPETSNAITPRKTIAQMPAPPTPAQSTQSIQLPTPQSPLTTAGTKSPTMEIGTPSSVENQNAPKFAAVEEDVSQPSKREECDISRQNEEEIQLDEHTRLEKEEETRRFVAEKKVVEHIGQVKPKPAETRTGTETKDMSKSIEAFALEGDAGARKAEFTTTQIQVRNKEVEISILAWESEVTEEAGRISRDEKHEKPKTTIRTCAETDEPSKTEPVVEERTAVDSQEDITSNNDSAVAMECEQAGQLSVIDKPEDIPPMKDATCTSEEVVDPSKADLYNEERPTDCQKEDFTSKEVDASESKAEFTTTPSQQSLAENDADSQKVDASETKEKCFTTPSQQSLSENDEDAEFISQVEKQEIPIPVQMSTSTGSETQSDLFIEEGVATVEKQNDTPPTEKESTTDTKNQQWAEEKEITELIRNLKLQETPKEIEKREATHAKPDKALATESFIEEQEAAVNCQEVDTIEEITTTTTQTMLAQPLSVEVNEQETSKGVKQEETAYAKNDTPSATEPDELSTTKSFVEEKENTSKEEFTASSTPNQEAEAICDTVDERKTPAAAEQKEASHAEPDEPSKAEPFIDEEEDARKEVESAGTQKQIVQRLSATVEETGSNRSFNETTPAHAKPDEPLIDESFVQGQAAVEDDKAGTSKEESTTSTAVVPERFKNSVVLGRGRDQLENPGNKKLRALALLNLEEYSKELKEKTLKSKVVSKIVSLLQEDCEDDIPAFVKRNKSTGEFEPVSNTASREKVGYTFRDILADRHKSSSKSKVARLRAQAKPLSMMVEETRNKGFEKEAPAFAKPNSPSISEPSIEDRTRVKDHREVTLHEESTVSKDSQQVTFSVTVEETGNKEEVPAFANTNELFTNEAFVGDQTAFDDEKEVKSRKKSALSTEIVRTPMEERMPDDAVDVKPQAKDEASKDYIRVGIPSESEMSTKVDDSKTKHRQEAKDGTVESEELRKRQPQQQQKRRKEEEEGQPGKEQELHKQNREEETESEGEEKDYKDETTGMALCSIENDNDASAVDNAKTVAIENDFCSIENDNDASAIDNAKNAAIENDRHGDEANGEDGEKEADIEAAALLHVSINTGDDGTGISVENDKTTIEEDRCEEETKDEEGEKQADANAAALLPVSRDTGDDSAGISVENDKTAIEEDRREEETKDEEGEKQADANAAAQPPISPPISRDTGGDDGAGISAENDKTTVEEDRREDETNGKEGEAYASTETAEQPPIVIDTGGDDPSAIGNKEPPVEEHNAEEAEKGEGTENAAQPPITSDTDDENPAAAVGNEEPPVEEHRVEEDEKDEGTENAAQPPITSDTDDDNPAAAIRNEEPPVEKDRVKEAEKDEDTEIAAQPPITSDTDDNDAAAAENEEAPIDEQLREQANVENTEKDVGTKSAALLPASAVDTDDDDAAATENEEASIEEEQRLEESKAKDAEKVKDTAPLPASAVDTAAATESEEASIEEEQRQEETKAIEAEKIKDTESAAPLSASAVVAGDAAPKNVGPLSEEQHEEIAEENEGTESVAQPPIEYDANSDAAAALPVDNLETPNEENQQHQKEDEENIVEETKNQQHPEEDEENGEGLQYDQKKEPATPASASVAVGSTSSVGVPSSNTSSPDKKKKKWGARFIVRRKNQGFAVLMVPPGKLGVSLTNRDDGKGTVVSKILQNGAFGRGQLCIGDRLVEIDGINVTKMPLSEIESLVASRADRPRRLTLDPVSPEEVRAGKEAQQHPHQKEDKEYRSQAEELQKQQQTRKEEEEEEEEPQSQKEDRPPDEDKDNFQPLQQRRKREEEVKEDKEKERQPQRENLPQEEDEKHLQPQQQRRKKEEEGKEDKEKESQAQQEELRQREDDKSKQNEVEETRKKPSVSSKKNPALGEFVWVLDGGTELPARLVSPKNDQSPTDHDGESSSDESEEKIEIQWTLTGKFERVPLANVRQVEGRQKRSSRTTTNRYATTSAIDDLDATLRKRKNASNSANNTTSVSEKSPPKKARPTPTKKTEAAAASDSSAQNSKTSKLGRPRKAFALAADTIERKSQEYTKDRIEQMPVEKLCLQTGEILETYLTVVEAQKSASNSPQIWAFIYVLQGRTYGSAPPNVYKGYFWRFKGSHRTPDLPPSSESSSVASKLSPPLNQPEESKTLEMGLEASSSNSFADNPDDSGSEESSDTEDSGDGNPRLGCICGIVHASSRRSVFWLQCDSCCSWYKLSSNCIGIDRAQADNLEHWDCWNCPSTTNTNEPKDSANTLSRSVISSTTDQAPGEASAETAGGEKRRFDFDTIPSKNQNQETPIAEASPTAKRRKLNKSSDESPSGSFENESKATSEVKSHKSKDTIENKSLEYSYDVLEQMPVEKLCLETGRVLETFETVAQARRSVSNAQNLFLFRYCVQGRKMGPTSTPHLYKGYFWRFKGSDRIPTGISSSRLKQRSETNEEEENDPSIQKKPPVKAEADTLNDNDDNFDQNAPKDIARRGEEDTTGEENDPSIQKKPPVKAEADTLNDNDDNFDQNAPKDTARRGEEDTTGDSFDGNSEKAKGPTRRSPRKFPPIDPSRIPSLVSKVARSSISKLMGPIDDALFSLGWTVEKRSRKKHYLTPGEEFETRTSRLNTVSSVIEFLLTSDDWKDNETIMPVIRDFVAAAEKAAEVGFVIQNPPTQKTVVVPDEALDDKAEKRKRGRPRKDKTPGGSKDAIQDASAVPSSSTHPSMTSNREILMIQEPGSDKFSKVVHGSNDTAVRKLKKPPPSEQEVEGESKEEMLKQYFTRKLIKVVVPPGRLGLKLSEKLVVRQILPHCELSDKIFLGDKLVEINNRNVETMPLQDFERFLADIANTERIWVFSRPCPEAPDKVQQEGDASPISMFQQESYTLIRRKKPAAKSLIRRIRRDKKVGKQKWLAAALTKRVSTKSKSARRSSSRRHA